MRSRVDSVQEGTQTMLINTKQPIINTDDKGNVIRVQFNEVFRTPTTIPFDDFEDWYRAYYLWNDMIHSPEFEVEVSLGQGRSLESCKVTGTIFFHKVKPLRQSSEHPKYSLAPTVFVLNPTSLAVRTSIRTDADFGQLARVARPGGRQKQQRPCDHGGHGSTGGLHVEGDSPHGSVLSDCGLRGPST